MSHKDRANTENLQVLLEQHWLHCRHLESERAWFMSVYAAITGGMFAFMAYSSSTDSMGQQLGWPLYFLIILTFFGFFHSTRWTYAFECHRARVNKLARILWIESEGKAMLDPTMDIPPMRILPESLRSNKVLRFLHINKAPQYLNDVFRTRYLFAFFYFFMLIGFVILSLLTDTPTWGQAGVITALLVAALLFVRWHLSLQEIKKTTKVVLEGCNGEWAQQRYLPFLVDVADKRNTELWAVDLDPQIKLASPGVTALWQSSRSKGKSCYIDDSSGRQTIEKPDEVSHVFIITPDSCHSKKAAFWLERLAPEGRIFIEKPLDASIKAAGRLKGALKRKEAADSIYAFDHYLARAYPFLHKSNRYIKEIGGVDTVEFHLLEPDGIPEGRASTFDKGVIFDLFCHILAVVGAAVNQNTTCPPDTIKTVKLGKVRRAQYKDCPISGETCALVPFTIKHNNHAVKVVSKIGYCVGSEQGKFMRLSGPKGRIELDFVNDKFTVAKSPPRDLCPQHVETFLEKLLFGKKDPLSAPGVLSFDTALEILKKLGEAKRQIGNKLPEYQCKDSINKIQKIM